MERPGTITTNELRKDEQTPIQTDIQSLTSFLFSLFVHPRAFLYHLRRIADRDRRDAIRTSTRSSRRQEIARCRDLIRRHLRVGVRRSTILDRKKRSLEKRIDIVNECVEDVSRLCEHCFATKLQLRESLFTSRGKRN